MACFVSRVESRPAPATTSIKNDSNAGIVSKQGSRPVHDFKLIIRRATVAVVRELSPNRKFTKPSFSARPACAEKNHSHTALNLARCLFDLSGGCQQSIIDLTRYRKSIEQGRNGARCHRFKVVLSARRCCWLEPQRVSRGAGWFSET